jgi:hypothetical protein
MAILTITHDDIGDEIGRWLYRTAYASLDSEQKAIVDSALKRGLRMFYSPTPLPSDIRKGIRRGHVWSFLRPSTTIAVRAAQTGTHTSDPGVGTTLTDTAATFITGANGDGAELVGQTVTTTGASSGTTYTNTVASVTDANNLEVTAAFDTAIASGDAYSISIDGNYNLPDACGGILGDLTFDSTTGWPPIQRTSQTRIRQLRQENFRSQTLRPQMYATRVRTTAMTAIQTYELMLWPKPDDDYTLHYRYVLLTDALDTTTNDTPLGGDRHAETILAACYAAAESYLDPAPRTFQKKAEYMERLAASIREDLEIHAADNLGPNLDPGQYRDRVSYFDRFKPVTYNGVEYP